MPRTFENQRVMFTMRELFLYVGLLAAAMGAWFDAKAEIREIKAELKYLHGDVKVPGAK